MTRWDQLMVVEWLRSLTALNAFHFVGELDRTSSNSWDCSSTTGRLQELPKPKRQQLWKNSFSFRQKIVFVVSFELELKNLGYFLAFISSKKNSALKRYQFTLFSMRFSTCHSPARETHVSEIAII